MSPIRTMAYGAGITIFSLFGGLLLGGIVGDIVFELTPGHDFQPLDPIQVILPASLGLACCFAGGAVWGIFMGRFAHAASRQRMAIAGALGFAPITVASALMLGVIEPIAAEKFGALVPLHRLFTLLFVPTAFLIAGVSAWAIGIGLRDSALARSLMWRIGLAAAITFLIVNLAMESAGWVVGGPNAAERSTMLTVLFVSNLGAGIVAGAMIGRKLTKRWGLSSKPLALATDVKNQSTQSKEW